MPNKTSSNLNTIRAGFMRRASAPDVTALALKLAYLIAYKYLNNKTGTARPSQETLARDLAVSVRTIQRVLDILQPLGLVIVPGHGPDRASTYWIDPDKATPVSPINTTPVSPIGGRKGDNRRHRTRHLTTEKATPMSAQLKKKNQEEEPREEYISEPSGFASPDSGDDAASSITDDRSLSDLRTWARAIRRVWALGNVRIDSGDDAETPRQFAKERAACVRRLALKLSREDQNVLRARDRQLGLGIWTDDVDNKDDDVNVTAFAEFWIIYPLKVGKLDAEKAYFAKAKAGIATAVMNTGAARYAAERAGQDAKFTKHPAKWIKGECWNDEPSSTGAVTIDQHGNVIDGPSGPLSIEEEILAEYADPSKGWAPK